MKRIWLFLTVVCATGCLLFAINGLYHQQAWVVQKEIAPKVLRFHVRANSDSEEDQRVKMEVKKAVLSYLNPLLQNSGTVQESKEIVKSHLKNVQAVAEQILEKQVWQKQVQEKQIPAEEMSDEAERKYDVRVSVKRESFPQKTYGDCTFPAGVYEALVIELGSGEGQNWWCMLYPSLCFVDETYGIVEKEEELKTNLPGEAYHWIKEEKNRKITFRLEWLRKILEFPI